MIHVHEGGLAKGLGRASLIKGLNHLENSPKKLRVTRGLGPVGLRLCCLLHTYLLKFHPGLLSCLAATSATFILMS